MSSLIAYTAFARAYELGSFSAVGRELGLTQSTVSKHIARLEAHLKVQLFARTTRKLNPTPEATRLYEGVQHLLDAADSIHSSVGATRAEPSGLLRVALPDSYGRTILMPIVARFLAAHPRVRLDVRLTDQAVNLVEEGVELGVRIRRTGQSSTLVARPIGIVEHLIVGHAGLPGGPRRTAPPHRPAAAQLHRLHRLRQGPPLGLRLRAGAPDHRRAQHPGREQRRRDVQRRAAPRGHRAGAALGAGRRPRPRPRAPPAARRLPDAAADQHRVPADALAVIPRTQLIEFVLGAFGKPG